MSGENGAEGAIDIDLSDIDLDSYLDDGDASTEAADEGAVTGEDEGDELATEEPTEDAEGDQPDADEGEEPLFTIKVNGRTEKVNLEELTARAQMGTDYTRKTQELADARRAADTYARLEQAFGSDFEGTVAELRKAYGLTPAADIEAMDPLERQVHELRQTVQTFEADRVAAAVQREIDAVQKTFNIPDDGVDELLEFAHTHRLGDLGVAYRAMRDEQREAAEAVDRSRQEKVAAKRGVPAPPAQSKRAARTTAKGPSAHMGLDEALELALAELKQ